MNYLPLLIPVLLLVIGSHAIGAETDNDGVPQINGCRI